MKALATGTLDILETSEDQSTQDSQPRQEEEEDDQQVRYVSFFSEEEEEEKKNNTVFNLQHTHNTRFKGPPTHESSPLTQTPSKGKAQTQKDTLILEPKYNLFEDLKREKENI